MSVLAPVPPLAGNNVPLNTISPPVGEPGDNPVDPALNEDTPLVGAVHDAVVPLEVHI